ncbi:hypothetical protein ACFC36_33725 [Streptomyces rubiginosohelvolus]|uniref:hypothetical protein n=1 Tax=Streptomyces rubiginosohelvolus TaxID=67362 RepID=UPI0035E20D68
MGGVDDPGDHLLLHSVGPGEVLPLERLAPQQGERVLQVLGAALRVGEPLGGQVLELRTWLPP